MKKQLFIVIAMFFATLTYAQMGLDLGIKVGANFANLNDITYDTSNKTGFVGGAFATIKFSDKIAIQGDLLYSQQGAKIDNEFIEDIKIDYITFPIVFKYYIIKRLNIQAGPQFGTVVNDNFDSDVNYNSFDMTGVVGIGVDLPLNLRVTGRYGFGLSGIDIITENTTFNTNAKNSVFTLTAGFSFL